MGFLRWGPGRHDACEIVYPAKLCSTTSADSIWNALYAASPHLSPDDLHALSQRVRALVVYQFPDGHASNKVVMSMMSQSCPYVCFLESHCVAHLLQLCWDSGAGKKIASPLYGFVQLMANASSNGRVGRAMESLVTGSDIVAGIQAPATDYNAFVLKYTLRRPLLVQSFFTQPGGSRHDAGEHAKLVAALEDDCATLSAGFSGPWYANKVCHYDFGALPGNRHSPDNKTCRSLIRASLTKLREHCISSLKELAANKWSSISNCVSRLTPGVLIHDVLGQAFARSLASQAELARLQQVIADDLAQQVAADAAAEQHCDANAFRVLRGKRVVDAHAFLRHADTPFLLLSFAVASIPIDKLFNTFFESEQFAKTEGGRSGNVEREPVGLMQELVSRTGILRDVHRMLAEPLFAPDSPLRQLLHVAKTRLIQPAQGIRLSRGLHLRLSGSFRYRFLLLFWENPMEMFRVLRETPAEQLIRIRQFTSPSENRCSKCEGLFLLRLRERLNAPPLLADEEKVQVVLEIFENLAEDPLIASIHELEGLHAGARSVCARSMCRRKRLPVSVFATQSLTRWRTLHGSRLGGTRRKVLSVRKHLLKKPKTRGSRTSCGFNMFVRAENKSRTVS